MMSLKHKTYFNNDIVFYILKVAHERNYFKEISHLIVENTGNKELYMTHFKPSNF